MDGTKLPHFCLELFRTHTMCLPWGGRTGHLLKCSSFHGYKGRPAFPYASFALLEDERKTISLGRIK